MSEKITLSNCKHCGSNACSTTTDHNQTMWFCYTCGFNSCTLYVEDNPTVKEIYSGLPELYKKISKVIDGTYWFPTVFNIPEKGMVYIDGISEQEYHWVGMLSTDVSEEEKEKFPIPNKPGEFYSKKIDKSTLKMFDKSNVMDALEYVNILY
jgi:hypothetical protein